MSDIKKMHMKSEGIDWEVPVETVPLPSYGKIYSKESWFYNKETVDIKAMTALEEDILTSQAYLKKGTVIDELIKSCIMSRDADPNDLTAGDKNALAISIRITGYGSDYAAIVNCPKCGHINEKTFDLTSLEINRLGAEPVEQGKNIFEYILPISKKKVLFKIMTGHDEQEKQKEQESKIKVLGEYSVGMVTSNLEHMIVSIDGVTDKSKINSFIKVMPAFDSKKLRTHMANIQPGIDMAVQLDCDGCEKKSDVQLPVNTEFFWPRT